jgi:hypothetical protein
MRPDVFSTELFNRYRRFEPAPVSTLSEISGAGGKSKAIEERHCGRAEQSMSERSQLIDCFARGSRSGGSQ